MHVEDTLQTASLLERWRELQSGTLALDWDWYELNERGEVVMTPRPTSRHQVVGADIAHQLNEQLGRRAVQDISLFTPDFGIRVPDVVWMPAARWEGLQLNDPLPFVPDVCVEVLSPSNRRYDIELKIRAYLHGGAREVIVVGLEGQLEYWSAQGKTDTSGMGLSIVLDGQLFKD